MPTIRNKLNNRILINLKDGKSIDLLENSTAEVTDDDLLSSHLQNLIEREIVIIELNEKKEDVKISETRKSSFYTKKGHVGRDK